MEHPNKYGIPTPYCYDINVYEEFGGTDKDVWQIFLLVTDHIPNKIIEAQALGHQPKDYTEVLELRQKARDELNRLTNSIK